MKLSTILENDFNVPTLTAEQFTNYLARILRSNWKEAQLMVDTRNIVVTENFSYFANMFDRSTTRLPGVGIVAALQAEWFRLINDNYQKECKWYNEHLYEPTPTESAMRADAENLASHTWKIHMDEVMDLVTKHVSAISDPFSHIDVTTEREYKFKGLARFDPVVKVTIYIDDKY